MFRRKVHKTTSSHVVNGRSCTLQTRCEPNFEAESIYDFAYTLRPSDAPPKSDPIASAYGHVILRDMLGESRQWYTEMDAPSDETAQLSKLFDSRGRLLEEHISNPYLRGKGVWGHELSEGSILLVTVLRVDESHRRQGLATWLLNHLLSESSIQLEPTQYFDIPGIPPRTPTATCPFAMAWPSALVPARLTKEQREEQWDAALKTFRGVGFRRIGRTAFFARALTDTSHPSLTLAAQDDAGPAATPGATDGLGPDGLPLPPPPSLSPFLRGLIQPEWTDNGHRYPLHALMLTSTSDEYIIDTLSKLTTETERAHICMADPTALNATPLHYAAMQARTPVIEKLLSLGAQESLFALTSDGFTPLDYLQQAMRDKRAFVLTFQVRSWPGQTRNCVLSQAVLLEAMGKPVPNENAVKWGCTCGQCVEGWFSPVMCYQIHVHAELATDFVRDGLEMEAEVQGRTRLFKSSTLDMIPFMDYLPKSIRDPGMYASFINGYSAVFRAIARVTESKIIPTADVVLRHALEAEYFDAQAVRFFLEKGGKVEHALNGLLHTAREQGPGGDGDFLETFGEEMGTLPTCENDEDYILLRSNLRIPPDLNGPLSGSWLETSRASDAASFGGGFGTDGDSSDVEGMCEGDSEEENDEEMEEEEAEKEDDQDVDMSDDEEGEDEGKPDNDR
ncbi:hypothetical protein PENSPDRAFT_684067 [Peniophora sp. CONT]|nr:hypothetical protein PENSPDRAFT_684067 [Peniophora sp. CONT]